MLRDGAPARPGTEGTAGEDLRPAPDAIVTGAGPLLVGWIVVEAAVIRTYSWLQPAFAGLGLVLAAIGWSWRRGRMVGWRERS